MLTAKENKLLGALEHRAKKEGIEIVTLEVVGAKKAPTIRVYIDTPNGVSFDELSCAQAWINELMDELDPFPGAYMLEVSSPGIDRPLRTLEHFARFAGEVAQIKTISPQYGRSTFTGKLMGCDGDEVLIEVEGLKVEPASVGVCADAGMDTDAVASAKAATNADADADTVVDTDPDANACTAATQVASKSTCVRIPINNIKRAHLKGVIDFNS